MALPKAELVRQPCGAARAPKAAARCSTTVHENQRCRCTHRVRCPAVMLPQVAQPGLQCQTSAVSRAAWGPFCANRSLLESSRCPWGWCPEALSTCMRLLRDGGAQAARCARRVRCMYLAFQCDVMSHEDGHVDGGTSALGACRCDRARLGRFFCGLIGAVWPEVREISRTSSLPAETPAGLPRYGSGLASYRPAEGAAAASGSPHASRPTSMHI